MKQIEEIKTEINEWDRLRAETEDLSKFVDETIDNRQQATEDSLLVEDQLGELEGIYKKFEKQKLYSGKFDKEDVVLAVHAGAGGDDAQDWAGMLLRMFLRYCENKGYQTQILNETKGAEAGIKSATIEVKGNLAYGNLKSEAGVHRLVRLSPFNSDNLRQTSFALVEVTPLLKEVDKEIEINPADLKIDTYRASGAGGQHVNTTDSAVRITHLPSKTVVTCQNERSQLQNKEKALAILRSKLVQIKEQEKAKEKQKLKGKHKSAEWGNQIRSYVLHPYKMVKDHRTGHQESNPDSVLDGEIDGFVEAFLLD